MTSKIRAVFAASLLVAIVAGLILLLGNDTSRGPIAADFTAAESVVKNPPPAPSEVRKRPRPVAVAKPNAGETTWEIDPGGQATSITLALDEAVLRDADGRETLTRLDPPATRETLAARLAGLSAPGGVFPVAYLTGEERSVATRRLVTPDLRVRIDDAVAEQIAADHRLAIKDRPAYAPGWVIMSAADAMAALDAMVELRESREVDSADVLLAVQREKRAMPNDTLINNQWHLRRSGTAVAGTDVNIEPIWNYPNAGSRGSGVRIGIVDDGLQTAHPDLAPNVDALNDKDWNGNDADPNPVEILDKHGTACAGNAAARGNNNLGVSGSAPEATLVGMRLIAGSVTDAQEAEAMAYLPDLIEIKSNSWGPEDSGTILEAPGPLALAALASATTNGRNGKGSIFLWAGGNGGNMGTSGDNSNYDGFANSIHTIAIGATDSTGNRAPYSERGSNLVVCAPSSGGLGSLNITTTDGTGAQGYNTSSTATGGDYANDFGGTSSATPTAAGIVALMLEENPNLGWRDVQEILIRSATKFRLTDADWVTNGAGIAFNHNFGSGLINATAAVNLAETWTNLSAATTATSTQAALSVPIPENDATGITRTFNFSSSGIRVEQVTVRVNINHTSRGDLEITLTSPSGMTSRLSEVHADSNDNYSNWTFSSVRHWGESSTGVWSLKIVDRSTSGNTTGGTLTAAEMKVFGTPGAAVNPAPAVTLTSPANRAILTPAVPVTVSADATDLTADGSAGSVASVEFFQGTTSIGVDTTAPYSVSWTPSTPGSLSITARATDSEGASGTSSPAIVTVLSSTADPAVASVISASGSLTAVNTTYGTASPPSSFTLSATNLATGVLVTPPPGFEVSQTAGGTSGYASTQTLGGTGSLASTTVFVRLAAGTTVGSYSGNVVCTSTGATPFNVATVASEVRPKLLTVTANNRIKPYASVLTLGSGQTGFTSSGLVGAETISSVTLTENGGALATDAPGVYAISPSAATGGTFNAGNYAIDYIDGALTVTGVTLADWLQNYPGLSQTAPTADPDGDGVGNFMEFFMGLNPTLPDRAEPTLSVGTNTLSFVYRRAKGITGVTGTEASSELAGPGWSSNGITETSVDKGSYTEVTATVPRAPGGLRKFMRLKVSQS